MRETISRGLARNIQKAAPLSNWFFGFIPRLSRYLRLGQAHPEKWRQRAALKAGLSPRVASAKAN
jgi:hypothetical protein